MATVLRERAPELQVLDDVLAEAVAGHGSVVLISGEAGIGKTSLVRAFLRSAGGRARLLVGSCDDLLSPRALGPLRDAARQAGGALAEKLAALAKAEKAEQIVVGLPRNMDGSYGYRCDACRRLGDLLSELTGLPVVYQDERLTTVLAYDLLSAGNVHGKKSKKQVDAVSASVILQSYLDSHR